MLLPLLHEAWRSRRAAPWEASADSGDGMGRMRNGSGCGTLLHRLPRPRRLPRHRTGSSHEPAACRSRPPP
ncbi:hypothetical protein PSMK_17930 [Phycisphaera mikurensis NBRC 102666]|uniref:Uncharacterized protein n=1 Tax=Phycisphaera mikurensis (strain NBRC 102666 / KCTC 22515 / FYK2301M01) TaxID=1142394 RepID=I0IFB4_PHYMF|nr:hypothetical protein PSMK_17930 [Phycisphaera mikurensis NBRC 102666]